MGKKKYYETEEFKKIQAETYAKLEASGFNDIEKSEDGYQLRKEVFDPEVEVAHQVEQEKQEVDLKILAEHQFTRDIDFTVFQLHTEGHSSRVIEEKLSLLEPPHLSHMQITRIINKARKDYLRIRL